MKNQFIFKIKYIYTIFFTVLFKITIEYGYFNFVHPVFGYSGFTLQQSQYKMIESYLVVFILTYLLAKLDDYQRPSKVVIYILFVNLYVPMSSLYWMQDKSRSFFLVSSLTFVLMYFILKSSKKIRIPTVREGSNIGLVILIIITVIVYGYLITTGGLQRININLLDVYSARQGYSEKRLTILAYLIPWQAHVVNLTFLIYGLIKRNKKIIFLTIFLQVFLFSMTNFKSYIFAPLVVLALYLIFKKGFKNSLLLFITVILSSLTIVLIFIYKLTDNLILLSIFLRRLFYVPASLQYTYFDYFEDKEKYKLSASLLSGIFDNPYNMNPVKLIAFDVFGKEFSPNAGIFADGFLNFGYIGIIIFALILGFVLVVFDSVSRNAPVLLSTAIIVIPAMSLVNSALFTSFATHGIIFAIFITWLTSSLWIQSDKLIE